MPLQLGMLRAGKLLAAQQEMHKGVNTLETHSNNTTDCQTSHCFLPASAHEYERSSTNPAL
jgi:hypothetical protein